MSCSPFDIRDYFLKELSDPQQRQVEAHIKTCRHCLVELERLHLMESALFALRDEEVPQRIAFVSDKIFEPSPLKRWWTAFWGSSARLAFAGAAMLSIAILVSAMTRPDPAPDRAPAPPPVVAQTISDAEIQARIEAAVTKAVAAVEQRYAEENRQLVSELKDYERRLVWAASEFDRLEKRAQMIRVSAGIYNPPPEPR